MEMVKRRVHTYSWTRVMELLWEYDSESSSSSLESNELGSREAQQVYLVTYSQADTEKCPTRQSFAEAVVKYFTTMKVSVLQWCCATEPHKRSSVHYHGRGYHLKNNLTKRHIAVHFLSLHANYFTAWRYVTKQDQHYEESKGDPDLSDSSGPRTMKAHEAMGRMRKLRRGRKEQDTESSTEDEALGPCDDPAGNRKVAKKKKRLTSFEVSEIVVEKNLRDRTELLAYANMQKRGGKTDLTEFVVNRGTKALNEVISNAWDMHNAEEMLRRRGKSRADILREASIEECVNQRGNGNDVLWNSFATTICAHNNSAQAFTNCSRMGEESTETSCLPVQQIVVRLSYWTLSTALITHSQIPHQQVFLG